MEPTPPAPSDVLGPVVEQFRQGSLDLKVHRDGFVIEHMGEKWRGPWADLERVYWQDVPTAGARTKRFVLSLQVPGHVFNIETLKGEGRMACREIVRLSSPVLAARALTAFERGDDVDFDAIQVSKTRVAIRTMFGVWKHVLFAKVTSLSVQDGIAVLEAGPAVLCEKPVDTIANLAGLEAILEKHAKRPGWLGG